MTKREMCKRNKQAAEERMRATAEYKEAERLSNEAEVQFEAGNYAEARKLSAKAQKLLKEARRA